MGLEKLNLEAVDGFCKSKLKGFDGDGQEVMMADGADGEVNWRARSVLCSVVCFPFHLLGRSVLLVTDWAEREREREREREEKWVLATEEARWHSWRKF